MSKKLEQGFTLIELLVVIAIIGLLSSVVLASLNSARAKGKDSAIKSEAHQLVLLYQEQYSDTGSYASLFSSGNSGSWYQAAAECASPVVPPTGTYATQQKNICTAIMNNETGCASGLCLYLNAAQTPKNTPDYFTIMVWLPGTQQFYCAGSSGGVSLTTGADWSAPGCWSNP